MWLDFYIFGLKSDTREPQREDSFSSSVLWKVSKHYPTLAACIANWILVRIFSSCVETTQDT